CRRLFACASSASGAPVGACAAGGVGAAGVGFCGGVLAHEMTRNNAPETAARQMIFLIGLLHSLFVGVPVTLHLLCSPALRGKHTPGCPAFGSGSCARAQATREPGTRPRSVPPGSRR